MNWNMGVSTLIPDAYEPAWTHLGDGIFNSPGTSITSDEMSESNPNGVSTTLTAVQFNTGNVFSGMVLSGNPLRKLLLLQNTSTATAPDFAPAIYVNFKQLASPGNGILLPPGVGLALDTSCPIDAVYMTYGVFSNTGGSVKISAIVGEGVAPGGTQAAQAAQGGGPLPTDPTDALMALATQVSQLQAILAGYLGALPPPGSA